MNTLVRMGQSSPIKTMILLFRYSCFPLSNLFFLYLITCMYLMLLACYMDFTNCSNHAMQSDVAIDMKQRYVAHCNVGTDIKQASFLGEQGQAIPCCIVVLVLFQIAVFPSINCIFHLHINNRNLSCKSKRKLCCAISFT